MEWILLGLTNKMKTKLLYVFLYTLCVDYVKNQYSECDNQSRDFSSFIFELCSQFWMFGFFCWHIFIGDVQYFVNQEIFIKNIIVLHFHNSHVTKIKLPKLYNRKQSKKFEQLIEHNPPLIEYHNYALITAIVTWGNWINQE